jgi:fusaric acid resistance family protein
VRIWLAVIVALYASFWLKLEAPSSAAITVAILALPTRGQGLEKAGFRLIATVIGVAASIAIAGIFPRRTASSWRRLASEPASRSPEKVELGLAAGLDVLRRNR